MGRTGTRNRRQGKKWSLEGGGKEALSKRGMGWGGGEGKCAENESGRIKEIIKETETSCRCSFPSLKKPCVREAL